MPNQQCCVCESRDVNLFRQVGQYAYYECKSCGLIFIAPDVLRKVDNGATLVNYSGNYWTEELYAARERAWSTSLARIAELFLYARIPVRKFVDIGSGPGYLLDALLYQLPSATDVFYANELFPPPPANRTRSENFLEGSFTNFSFDFDGGSCIEVIEHLTPAMVKSLFADLATKSKPNSIYLFNTGLSHYIKNEDPGYLDPHVRGHIVGWSIPSLKMLVASTGFEILPIPGKSWAFIAEYRPDHNFRGNLEDRIWHALPENASTLKDQRTGGLMYVLGLDTARAYR